MQIVRVRKVGYKVQYFSIRLAGGQEWDGKVAIKEEVSTHELTFDKDEIAEVRLVPSLK